MMDEDEDDFDPWTVPLPSLAVRRAQQHAQPVPAVEDPATEIEEPNEEVTSEARRIIDLARKAWQTRPIKSLLKSPPVKGIRRPPPQSKKKQAVFALDRCVVVSIEGELSKLQGWNDEAFPTSTAGTSVSTTTNKNTSSASSVNTMAGGGGVGGKQSVGTAPHTTQQPMEALGGDRRRSLNAGKMDKLLEENVMLSSTVHQLGDELTHQREVVASLKRELSVVTASTSSSIAAAAAPGTASPTDSRPNQIQALRKDSEDLVSLRKAHVLLRKETEELKVRMATQMEEVERLRREHPVLRSSVVAATANLKRSAERVEEQEARAVAAEDELRAFKIQVEEEKQKFTAVEYQVQALRGELDQARTSHALDQEVIGELHSRATTLRRSTKKFEEWITTIREEEAVGSPSGPYTGGINPHVLDTLERMALWLQGLAPPPPPLPLSFDFERDDTEDEDEDFAVFTGTLVENLRKNGPLERSSDSRANNGLQRNGSGLVRNGSGLTRNSSGLVRSGSELSRSGSGLLRSGSGLKPTSGSGRSLEKSSSSSPASLTTTIAAHKNDKQPEIRSPSQNSNKRAAKSPRTWVKVESSSSSASASASAGATLALPAASRRQRQMQQRSDSPSTSEDDEGDVVIQYRTIVTQNGLISQGQIFLSSLLGSDLPPQVALLFLAGLLLGIVGSRIF